MSERLAAVGLAGVDWRRTARLGSIAGLLAVYICLVGIVEVFSTRDLITGIISLGQTAILLAAVAAGFLAVRGRSLGLVPATVAGAFAGAVSGLFVAAFMAVSNLVGLRGVLLHASPATFDVVSFGLGEWAIWVPVVVIAIVGGLTGTLSTLPRRFREPITAVLLWLLVLGVFAGLIRPPLLASPVTEALGRFLFTGEGLTVSGAVTTVVAVLVIRWLRQRADVRARYAALSPARRRTVQPIAIAIGLLFVAWLPQGAGPFFAQVAAVVAIYVLMGLGLNITLGLAGLLDLGFVAFFAVGAYTVGLLTSTAEYGIAQWPWWLAVPFGVFVAMCFGAIFGLPILGIRGDYLAIATMGFGEIVRLLVGSDLLKSFLGGPRGIINIPKPIEVTPDSFLAGPLQIYYIALAAAALVAFVAIRLRASRLGRAWLAIREDEDVAEALGVNLVRTKLLAYMLGAAFAGLGGAVNAALIGSIFPSSIQLIISLNVAALIIVGGMGSIPGVIVGAIFLIGLPEAFREFSEYRYLAYGLALIVMMQFRPEGLLPSRIVRRELHEADENIEPGLGAVAAAFEPAMPAPGSRGPHPPGSRP